MKYLLIVFFLIIVGCSVSKDFTIMREELYYEKCGGCHRLYSKQEFTNEKWQSEVEEMSKKAKLSEDEKRMIIEYLTNNNLQGTKP